MSEPLKKDSYKKPVAVDPAPVEFDYQTEEELRSDITVVKLHRMPNLEIGVTPANTNRANERRDYWTRKVQSKRAYDRSQRLNGKQAVEVNNRVVAAECLHFVRVIGDESDQPKPTPIKLPAGLGLYEKTEKCHYLMLSKLPAFRDEVNRAMAEATEATEEAEEDSAKN